MELRKRLVAIVGITALMMGMTAGMVHAQPIDTGGADATVTINCLSPMTVTALGDIDFGDFDLGPVQADNDTAAAGRLNIEVSMGCYLGQWHVDASISAFVAPAIPSLFAANHFELRDASVDQWALDGLTLNACSPNVPGGIIDFDGILSGDGGEILGTSSGGLVRLLCLPLLPPNTNAGAPLVTLASYEPWLVDIHPLQPSGVYEAELTLELYAD